MLFREPWYLRSMGCQTHNNMSHDVAQAYDTHQSARVSVICARNNDETMDTSNLDQRKDSSKRVVGVARYDTREIGSSLLECLRDCEVQRLVRAETYEGLEVRTCAAIHDTHDNINRFIEVDNPALVVDDWNSTDSKLGEHVHNIENGCLQCGSRDWIEGLVRCGF